MKHRVVELLKSVPDGSPLRLARITGMKTVPFSEQLSQVKCHRFCALKNCAVKEAVVTPADCAQCYTKEIIDGELISDTGKTYPIVNGIPRLLSDETKQFMAKNKKSFSLEWKYFRFGERNWGQDIEFRKQLFVRGMGVEPASLGGKLMFDAGCGSGLLSMEVASTLGMEVLALDLASGIEKAFERNTCPFVYFVQGSVLEPPVQDRSVDYIYCAGVLIHLPDTRQAFRLLPRCLKLGGRYFVWIYRPIATHERVGDRIREHIYHWVRTNITSRLPIAIQEGLYLCLVVPFILQQRLRNLVRKSPNTRTWREKMQNFVDGLSPMHVNRHTEQEVLDWYHECGFRDAVVAYSERYGFGFRGDLGTNGVEVSKASGAPVTYHSKQAVP
jgi:ubiquinone/menaquinone biosynthesis C-methylase UbiE/uncharacterized protein YbaR (Trm112 family)